MISQGKMTCFHFSKQGRKIQFFSQLFSLLFFPQFGIFDFSHIGTIYGSEITKTMKGLLNSMAHRSNFSMEKKVLLCTWEKWKSQRKSQNFQVKSKKGNFTQNNKTKQFFLLFFFFSNKNTALTQKNTQCYHVKAKPHTLTFFYTPLPSHHFSHFFFFVFPFFSSFFYHFRSLFLGFR